MIWVVYAAILVAVVMGIVLPLWIERDTRAIRRRMEADAAEQSDDPEVR